MKPKDGRKALVVFSDGVDRGSKETLNDAVDAADRAGVAIYTIYFKGEQERSRERLSRRWRTRMAAAAGRAAAVAVIPAVVAAIPVAAEGAAEAVQSEPGVDGKKIMEKIATRTGGRYFEAKKKDKLDEIYAQIAEELRGQYLLHLHARHGGQRRRLPQDRPQGQQGRPDCGYARRLLRAGRGCKVRICSGFCRRIPFVGAHCR